MDDNIKQMLLKRSESCCELCGSNEAISFMKVEPKNEFLVLCKTCTEQIEDESKIDINHWHCLNETIWSQTPAVQVMAYRVLNKIAKENCWTQELLDMIYLDDDLYSWAKKK